MTQIITKDSTPPSGFGSGTVGGGSSGGMDFDGEVEIADGADETQGSKADPVYADDDGSDSGSVLSLLKGIFVRGYNSSIAIGSQNNAAYTSTDGSANGTQVGLLKGLFVVLRAAFGALPATTDRSGTATTTSGTGLNVPANANRRGLVGQNVSAVNIGFNEQNGTAVIGASGTYTVTPGQSFSINSNKQVNFIAASGTAAVTLTEW